MDIHGWKRVQLSECISISGDYLGVCSVMYNVFLKILLAGVVARILNIN
jgi:hypothetical protein